MIKLYTIFAIAALGLATSAQAKRTSSNNIATGLGNWRQPP